jgi:hypothetical protein
MKNNNQCEICAMIAQIEESINKCHTCGESRMEVSFEHLPEDFRKAVECFRANAQFLYCPNCNEHSMLTNWE